MGTGLEIILLTSAAVSIDAQQDAKSAAARQNRAQNRIRQAQRAQNASDAARERRQQIRDERIRRARVLQASENTGVEGSSGEIGAIGALSTQFASNIATNIGRLKSAEDISIFSQQAADAGYDMQSAQARGQLANSIFSIASNPQIGGAIGSIFDTKPEPIDGYTSAAGMST